MSKRINTSDRRKHRERILLPGFPGYTIWRLGKSGDWSDEKRKRKTDRRLAKVSRQPKEE